LGTLLLMEPTPWQLSVNSGLHPLRPSEQRSGHTQAFTDTLDDPR
jgi:hypothetical protein